MSLKSSRSIAPFVRIIPIVFNKQNNDVLIKRNDRVNLISNPIPFKYGNSFKSSIIESLNFWGLKDYEINVIKFLALIENNKVKHEHSIDLLLQVQLKFLNLLPNFEWINQSNLNQFKADSSIINCLLKTYSKPIQQQPKVSYNVPELYQKQNKLVKVGIGVFLFNKKYPNKVLIGKRSSNLKIGADTYALPGGHLEFHENIFDCATREVKEETNLDICNLKLLTFDNALDKKSKYHYFTIYVTAKVINVEILKNLEPDKCYSWKWEVFDQSLLKDEKSILFNRKSINSTSFKSI